MSFGNNNQLFRREIDIISEDTKNPLAGISESDIIEKVKASAIEEWGHDFRMVDYRINNNMSAFRQLKNLKINTDVERITISNAISEWKFEFTMVLSMYRKQIKAYKKLKELILDAEIKKVFLEDALEEWEDDYDMVEYEYSKQLKAYNKVSNI